MARLTRDGLRARQWDLFLETVAKYSALFWLCVGLGLVFAGIAAYLLLASRRGALIAGVLAVGFFYVALNAPRQAWARETETETGTQGVKHRTVGGHPLAGDLDPDAAPRKQAASDDESVGGTTPETPEQPQGPEPAQE